jgi:hypothetical protein
MKDLLKDAVLEAKDGRFGGKAVVDVELVKKAMTSGLGLAGAAVMADITFGTLGVGPKNSACLAAVLTLGIMSAHAVGLNEQEVRDILDEGFKLNRRAMELATEKYTKDAENSDSPKAAAVDTTLDELFDLENFETSILH